MSSSRARLLVQRGREKEIKKEKEGDSKRDREKIKRERDRERERENPLNKKPFQQIKKVIFITLFLSPGIFLKLEKREKERKKN